MGPRQAFDLTRFQASLSRKAMSNITPPKSVPPRLREGTCARCCRWSSRRKGIAPADNARGNQCAADKESRSSPRSGAVVRLSCGKGSAAPVAPTAHPSDLLETRRLNLVEVAQHVAAVSLVRLRTVLR